MPIETQVPYNVQTKEKSRTVFTQQCAVERKRMGKIVCIKYDNRDENKSNLWSSEDPITYVIASRASSRQCTRELSSLDNSGTTLLDGGYEFSVQPNPSNA